jgi:PAS domain S-box-containing protein
VAKPRRAGLKARAGTKAAKPALDLRKENAALKHELAHALKQQSATARELRVSLEYQTAISNVLKVISRSAFELQPVLDSVCCTAQQLCGAELAGIAVRKGERYRYVATSTVNSEWDRRLRETQFAAGRGSVAGRVALDRRVVHIADLVADTEYHHPEFAPIGGARTALGVPLLREDTLLGVIFLGRSRVRPFTARQIDLVRTFADQAVIAIENTRLFDEVQQRAHDLRESLQQQTATADVLKIISRSSVDLETVLNTLVETVARLCRADQAYMWRRRDEVYQLLASCGLSEEAKAYFLANPPKPGRGTVSGRVALEGRSVHIPDVLKDPEYTYTEAQKIAGFRTVLGVALLREQKLLGIFSLNRNDADPFTAKEIELASTFADQAVIAIENARLFEELRERTGDLEESLKYQTATSDVLKVINRSTLDLQRVLDTLIQTAAELCDTSTAAVAIRHNDIYRYVATARCTPEYDQVLRSRSLVPGRDSIVSRVLLERKVVHIVDAEAEAGYDFPEAINIGRVRSLLGVPMFRDDEVVGVIGLSRQRVEPFTERQIELMRTFAAQAVIAMENARLLGELRERTTDLARSVDELTATGDVLKIISRSSVDLETVLDTLVETVARLCRADQALVFRRRDDLYHLAAAHGLSEETLKFMLAHPVPGDRGSISGRVELERRAVHIPDILQDSEYTVWEGQKAQGQRTMLGVPLLREEALLGVFIVNRTKVEAFTKQEIELATTFADQAVIAIENARLFEELRERQAELRVTFDNMGDGVAMFDAAARLAAWNRNLQEMLELPDALLAKRPSFAELFRYLAERGEFGSDDLEAQLSRSLEDTRQEVRYERTRPDGHVIEVRRNPVPDGGFVLIYADITKRKRAEEAVRLARDAAEKALRELQTAQDRLVQTQKLASLGQLTAGIAHEIKNPLNFVNNFSALSVELTDELNDILEQAQITEQLRKEVDELTGMLKDNLSKVVQHGRRADSIVKNMLLHSREGSGELRAADVNALVDESLNLAYHGARAEKPQFKVTLHRDFDPQAGMVEVFPQEITRVLLNLLSNGFYAVTERKADNGFTDFEPQVTATTRGRDDHVEIRIRDNGSGIPPEVRGKMFNPFFTTKPAGEGTGLGLSMSHEIIVKQHGGTIEVLTEPGAFTEFIVILQRKGLAQKMPGDTK